jgi:hypothetical protein
VNVVKWLAACVCGLLALVLLAIFGLSLLRAYESHGANALSCEVGPGHVNNNLTYVQIELLDQDPTEPTFKGNLFVYLGDAQDKGPQQHIDFRVSGNRIFAPTVLPANFRYGPMGLWMEKRLEFALTRTAGSHRDFPFDSANFDFDLSWSPAVQIDNFFLRNRNPSFDVRCERLRTTISSNKIHVSFEARRNPLVQLTAVVLLGAGFLFSLGIAGFVRPDALPPAVASFFFSLWSFRGILSSEMKIFPTIFDLLILSLCVWVLVLLGLRLAFDPDDRALALGRPRPGRQNRAKRQIAPRRNRLAGNRQRGRPCEGTKHGNRGDGPRRNLAG